MLVPIVTTLAYPWLLGAFHRFVNKNGGFDLLIDGVTVVLFIGVMSIPIIGLVWASRTADAGDPSPFEIRARRLAFLSIAAPPLFVFTGVARGLLGGPLSDEIVWVAGWLAVSIYVWFRGNSASRPAAKAGGAVPRAKWRVAHGVSAAFIVLFVLFHLTNHLFGLAGPEAHAAIMEAGRILYRSPLLEPVLVAFLLFQVASGAGLAWRWSAIPLDALRVFQVGSGVYLAGFVVAHLNSALVSARAVRGVETDWLWASGAPGGLIFDAWNIRLVPHYTFGVFFVLAHFGTGLRQILIAHGASFTAARRAWFAGLISSGLVALAIMAALCGLRL